MGVEAVVALVGATGAVSELELAGAVLDVAVDVAGAEVVAEDGAVVGDAGTAGAVPSAARDGSTTASWAPAASASTPKQANGVAATKASPTPFLTHRNPANWIVRVPP